MKWLNVCGFFQAKALYKRDSNERIKHATHVGEELKSEAQNEKKNKRAAETGRKGRGAGVTLTSAVTIKAGCSRLKVIISGSAATPTPQIDSSHWGSQTFRQIITNHVQTDTNLWAARAKVRLHLESRMMNTARVCGCSRYLISHV